MATILKVGDYAYFEVDAATAAGFIKLVDAGMMRPVSREYRAGGYTYVRKDDDDEIEVKMGQKVEDKTPPPPAPEPEVLCLTESQKALEYAGPTEDIPF